MSVSKSVHLKSYSSMNRKFQKDSDDFWHWRLTLKVRLLSFLTPFTQLTAKLINFLWGLMLVLGLKKGLLECATVFIKSEFILMQAYDYNTKTLLLCVWNSICIIWMFLVFLNLWSLFFCVYFSSFHYVFSFSLYTLWCILMLFLEVHNIYLFRSIIHYKKPFAFSCWKCLTMAGNA